MEDYMGVPGLTMEDVLKTNDNIKIAEEQPPIRYFGDPYNNSPYGTFINKPKPTPIVPQQVKEVYLSVPSTSTSSVTVKSPVKIATPQYVDFNEASLNPIGTDVIKYLFFEQINGQELLLLSNTNFVNPENIVYQPIINIANFKTNYDPKKIIALQDTSDTYFLNFPIKLNNKIPDVPTTESTNGKNVYIATTRRTDLIYTEVVTYYNKYARIVIETKDMENDENVEIQILSGGTIYTDLIEEYA
jgi:hypothetical protein